jgi:hypothetical protein
MSQLRLRWAAERDRRAHAFSTGSAVRPLPLQALPVRAVGDWAIGDWATLSSAGPQQAAGGFASLRAEVPYVVLSPTVWKASQAMPAGSEIQLFSDLA